MKQVSVLLFAVVIFTACQHPRSHKAGLVKQDTIMAAYITQPYGPLQGGPAIRIISYKEKVSTKDSITFTKSVDLDTTCTVFPSVPFIDSITKKQKVDSLGNPMFKANPITLPAKYIFEIPIPTH